MGRNRNTHIETWLQPWCHQQDIGFLDHGSLYMAPRLLVTDRVQTCLKEGKDLRTGFVRAHQEIFKLGLREERDKTWLAGDKPGSRTVNV